MKEANDVLHDGHFGVAIKNVIRKLELMFPLDKVIRII